MTRDLAQSILTLARSKGWTVTCAESCTGGKVAAALTDLPGSSAIFERGFVTYSNEAKTDMVGVPPELFPQVGAVSPEVALAMARGAAAAAHADVAVAISGIAGPGGSDSKPEGRVCYAIVSPAGARSLTLEHGALGRDNVRDAATRQALTLILEALQG